MKFRGNKMLGLAVGEKSVLVAEVSAGAEGRRVTRAGVFTYVDDANLQKPDALGSALGAFLKQEGYTAKAAVFGVPAKWVVTKSKELPPVDPSLAADMLRLQLESEFSAEIKDLVYDYAGQTSPTEPSQVLLAAIPQRHIETIRTIAQAAGLDVQGIAPTAVTLSVMTAGTSGSALVLSITPSGTELSAQRGASPSLLRHIGSAAAVTANVAGEVRRAALAMVGSAGTNGNGNGSANGHSQGQIVVWDDGIADPAARRAAMDALGPSARVGQYSALGVGNAPDGIIGCAAAVALAVAGLADQGLAIDFLHARLAPPKKALIERRILLAIGAALVIILGIIYTYSDLHQHEAELATKQAELDRTKDARKATESEVAMIEYAQKWRAMPRYLDCLRDLTLAFPPDGQIFATSFTLHDTMKGEFVGKSTESSDKTILSLAARLKKDKRFQDVNLQNVVKQQAVKGHEFKFTITFSYVPTPPSQP